MNDLGALQGRHYYVNQTTQKVTWKHPTVTNQRAKFGQAAVLACQNSVASGSHHIPQVKEKLDPDLDDVEIDHERKHYEVRGVHFCHRNTAEYAVTVPGG